jgi:hypothetical protein
VVEIGHQHSPVLPVPTEDAAPSVAVSGYASGGRTRGHGRWV